MVCLAKNAIPLMEILKQIAWLIIALGCLFIQLVALVFAGIAWVFNKLVDLLCGISQFAMDKCDATQKREEISTEEVPT